MGLLPNSQFGDVAVLDIPVSVDTGSIEARNVQLRHGDTFPNVYVGTAGTTNGNYYITAGNSQISHSDSLVVAVNSLNSSGSASFNILALRQAEALQKYREITQSVDDLSRSD